MDIAQEYRTWIIVLAVIVIGYLVLQTDLFVRMKIWFLTQWYVLPDYGKVMIFLLCLYIAYYLWTGYDH